MDNGSEMQRPAFANEPTEISRGRKGRMGKGDPRGSGRKIMQVRSLKSVGARSKSAKSCQTLSNHPSLISQDRHDLQRKEDTCNTA